MVWETGPWEAMTNPFRNTFSTTASLSISQESSSKDSEKLESGNKNFPDPFQSLNPFVPQSDSIITALSSSPQQSTIGESETDDALRPAKGANFSASTGSLTALPIRVKGKRPAGPTSSKVGHSLNSSMRPPASKAASGSKKHALKPVHGPDQNTPSKNVLIAVFGMTGTGKTSLIKSLAGARADKLQTGHGLESCTQFIEKVECQIGNSQVTLVDTPGFDDSHRSDTEILSLIAAWLQTEYTRETFLSGIIYLHRISDIRMSGSSIKNLRMFRKLCGSDNMSRVKLVTTMWDKVTPEEGAIRENDLLGSKGFWSPMIASGCLVERHDGTPASAQALVLGMLDNVPMMIKLQAEIASGKALIDTDAGASINEEILRLRKEHEEDLEAVKEEMSLAMEQGNKALQAQLQEEHARVVARIEKNAEDQRRLQELRAGKLERDLQAAITARRMLEESLNGRISSLEKTLKDKTPNATCRRCKKSFEVHGFGTTDCPFCGKKHFVKLKSSSWI